MGKNKYKQAADMNSVNQQVSAIWGSAAPGYGQPGYPYKQAFALNESDSRYVRDNVITWLLHWHEFNQLGGCSLSWARARADMQIAVELLSPGLRDLFELYCVLGYSQDDVQYVFGWQSSKTFSRQWRLLVYKICKQIMCRNVSMGLCKRLPLPMRISNIEEPWPVKP